LLASFVFCREQESGVTNPNDIHNRQAQALATRLFMASLASAELIASYLGMRLGLYRVLADGPVTADELATLAGVAPRYAREWLEQQAASGIVTVDRVAAAPQDRRYSLSPGHIEVLTDPDSLFSVTPLTLMPVGGIGRVVPQLLEAFRAGTGLPYDQYGEDFRGGQAGLNKPIFMRLLPGWLRSAMPDVHARLLSGGRIADIACGAGWSSIALARSYPRAQVDGFDLNAVTIDEARQNSRDSDVGGRVSFEVKDGGDPALAGRYDLVCIFDALHDMARPVDVLRTCRRIRTDKGSVLLMEPNVGKHFTAPANETERFFYAISLLHCLPVGLSEQPSAATGTVMRPALVLEYARSAGFSDVQVLPVEYRFHRLYRLVG
jgi:2-polyprenyl-3-methyl-5-hydroxy-6-metoxy-1,4-benzoquinol methylase